MDKSKKYLSIKNSDCVKYKNGYKVDMTNEETLKQHKMEFQEYLNKKKQRQDWIEIEEKEKK